jgi:lipopolysaccharide export system permease protein
MAAVQSLLRKVDKLVMLEFGGPLLFGIAMFSMLTIVVVVVQESLKFIIKYDVSPTIFLQMMVYAAPQFIILSIPMGVLLGTLISVGKLNSELQITALRTCGVSLYRLLAPYFIVGTLLSGLTFLGNETVVPWGLESLTNLKNSLLNSGEDSEARLGPINEPIYKNGKLQWLLVAEDSEGNRLYDVFLLFRDQKNHANDQLIIATWAEWEGQNWTFHEVQTYSLKDPRDGTPGQMQTRMSSMVVRDLNISPESLRMRKQDVESLRIVQLQQLLRDELASGVDPESKTIRDIMTKMYGKYAIPFTPLVFIIIAVPLSIMPQRSSTSMGMGFALLIVMIYYVLLSVCQKMGASGIIVPMLAAWLPNILICGIGLILMQRRERN